MQTFYKTPPVRDKEYLAFIRTQACLLKSVDCLGSVVPHHEGRHGCGIKASDYETIPLCMYHHNLRHNRGKSVFKGIDIEAEKKRLMAKYRAR